MNEKKSLQDILGQIAEESGVTKKLSENFLRVLFEIVEEALEKDGIAKIPNLGTFKIVAIEERKSVNVQNGNEMIIPAHKKVSFTPEKNLKEEINKPYAHLETYVLKDDGPVDSYSDEEEDEELEEAVIDSQETSQTTISAPIIESAINTVETPTENVGSSYGISNTVSQENTQNNTYINNSNPSNMTDNNLSSNDIEGTQINNENPTNTNDIENTATSQSEVSSNLQKAIVSEDTTTSTPETTSEITPEETSVSTGMASEPSSEPSGNVSTSVITPNDNNETNTTVDNTTTNTEVVSEQVSSIDNVTESEVKKESNEVELTSTEESSQPAEPVSAENAEGTSNSAPATSSEDEKDVKNEVTENKEEKKEKKSKEEISKNKKWIPWLFLGLIIILALLFGIRYAMDNNILDNSFNKQNTVVDTVPNAPVTQDSTKAPVKEATNEDDLFETEAVEEPDCFENPDMCRNTAATSDTEENTASEDSNIETHSFDQTLVDYMNSKHPDLNFPSTIKVREDYVVKEGSRLAQISRNNFDGEFIFWGYIYFFNTDVLSKPGAVKTGMTLKIPDLDAKYLNTKSSTFKKLAEEVNNLASK